MRATFAAVLVGILAATACAERFSVVKGSKGLKVIRERDARLPRFTDSRSSSQVLVEAEYSATMLSKGWDTMKITTNPAADDNDQAYAAGYFEGRMTYEHALDHFNNNYPSGAPANVVAFLLQHAAWLESFIAAKQSAGTMTPYWTHVALMWKQWNGMFDGMNSVATRGNWTKGNLLVLTSMGDMFDLIPGLNQNARDDWRGMEKKQFDRWFAAKTHCSSLFKLTGDMQDIFFGHVAWYNFNTLMRIFKHYTLNFKAAGTTAKTISMSSYPGMLSSFDDFYVADSGIAAIETSLAIMNYSIYDGNIRPDLLLYWMRVMVANRMARTAPEWTEIIAVRNSGTYNNQWMVLDMNLFTPGKPLLPNTMWIAEQIPGLVASQDVTDILRYGYYPSYNVPMNKTVFELAGYAEGVRRQGPEMNSYDMCVRAQIFRRDQGTVKDLATYKHMMQYNNYEQDPVSNGNPLYAISSRADLDPHVPQCFGGLDAKVSSYSMWKKGQVVDAFSGPTPQQPRFGYNITMAKCGPHQGLPSFYNFDWMTMTP